MIKTTLPTDLSYTDRESKAAYVWSKYKSVLECDTILDVGADQCYLKKYLPDDTHYLGIGLGSMVDLTLNLEKEPIPYSDNAFDCVLALDVLEHLDNAHEVFDRLCSLTRDYLIVSLPNPLGSLCSALRNHTADSGQLIKYYGFPQTLPEDRHKWFFTQSDAKLFIEMRGRQNGMEIVQIDFHTGHGKARSKRYLRALVWWTLTRNKLLKLDDFCPGTLWAVLKKRTA